MKRKVLVGIAFVYLTVAIFSVAPSVSADDQINFGQIVSGSIDNPLQVKIYSFSATANDQFLVRVSRTEGEFDPQFKLYSPNGKKIAEDYSVGSLVEGSGTLPDRGTYQILICDKGGNDIGKFSLLIVRINNPTQRDQINFGQIVSGSIDNPLQVKIYSFSATANDRFLVRVSRTEGEFDPQFKLYSPNGKKIAEDYSVGSLVEGSGTLPDSGTYQILICDKGGNDIGKFSLLIVRINNPTQRDQINFGQIVSGSIDNPLQVKIYSFSATANDRFLVRVSRTEGEFDPQFKLYSPNGKKIAEDYSVGSLVEGSGTLPDSGTYQILICDKGGNDIGKFSLLIVRMNSHTSVTIPTPTSQTVSSIPTPKPTSAIPTSVTTQIEIKGLSILDIQKSSETAPEINITPIEEQMLPNTNTTVLLSGTASSDSGIESVTVNGQYAGTEYWSAPLALSLGDNNVVIVSTGNDGSTTIEKVRLTATTPELESKRSSHVPYFVALIGAIATIVAAIIIALYTKKEK